jgi:hypothetical protein
VTIIPSFSAKVQMEKSDDIFVGKKENMLFKQDSSTAGRVFQMPYTP